MFALPDSFPGGGGATWIWTQGLLKEKQLFCFYTLDFILVFLMIVDLLDEFNL